MENDEADENSSQGGNLETDRVVRVLALEYGTLRDEILARSTARYQFVGFATGAAGLIGAGIGLSSYGIKTWILVGLASAVIFIGLYGYLLMRYYAVVLSARIAVLEGRINDLVPAEPGFERLLSWQIDHQGLPLFGGPRAVMEGFRLLTAHPGSRRHIEKGSG
jgi:hypothetical protein